MWQARSTKHWAGFELAKFILIDHSLRSVGGHHYEYAVHILREAQRAGYDIVLATHRDFRGQGALPQGWRLLALFRDDVYSNHALLQTGRCKQRRAESGQSEGTSTSARISWNPQSLFTSLRQFFNGLGFHRRSQRLAAACRELFRSVRPQPGDVVLAATFSAFDLAGLASCLKEHPGTKSLDWHLQFHHDFLEGRETDYDAQTEVLQATRDMFQHAQKQIPNHRLRFHTTTMQLASQYNRLDVGPFTELPYPVNPKFYQSEVPHDTNRSPAANPKSSRESKDSGGVHPARCLNITCAGGMRREKGSHQMAELIRQLWDPYLATGQLRLHIQASQRSFEKVSRQQEQLPGNRDVEPLVRVPHPLEMDDYVRLIHSSDLGLFLYDSHIYYARCSGILAEMLAAGVPVIVPAGCWLANQIAEPIYRHLDAIHQQTPSMGLLRSADVQWNRLLHADEICVGARHADLQGELPVPKGATGLMVRFRHKTAGNTGRYVQVRFAEHAKRGERLDEQVMVLGQRQQADFPISAFIALNESTARVELTLRDAYGRGGIEIADLECSFLASRDFQGKNPPIAAVGVITSDPSQIPRLLAETIEHYDHYRRTAKSFSHEWMMRHAPRNTFATLMNCDADAGSGDNPMRAA